MVSQFDYFKWYLETKAMTTFLERLAKFDADWEINNCIRPRTNSPSHKKLNEWGSYSDNPETRKRKLGSCQEPIKIDDCDLMDHSINFSSEQVDSDVSGSSNSSQESSASEPPKKKRRLSSDLSPETSLPKDVNKSTITTTVTTPTAVITISSPREVVCNPIAFRTEQRSDEHTDVTGSKNDNSADEKQDEVQSNPIKEENETINEEMKVSPNSSSALKTTAKVAAWIAWSGLVFALGSMTDPNTIASLFH